MNDHVAIMGYDKKHITIEEARIFLLIWMFEIMDTHTIVNMWLEGQNNLIVYLGKSHITFIVLLYVFLDNICDLSALFYRSNGEYYCY